MKKIFIVLFLICIAFCIKSNAQSPGFRSGLFVGIGEATIKNSTISNQSGKLALLAGFGLNHQFTKNIGLYGNILFTSIGTSFNGSDKANGVLGSTTYSYTQNNSLYYIEIPIMPKLSIGFNNFHIKAFAGPSINFNLYGKQSKTYADANYNQNNGYKNQQIQNLNLVQYSLVYGAGFDVELDNNDILFLEIRDNMGLNSFGQINGANSFNRYFAIGIGYLYTY